MVLPRVDRLELLAGSQAPAHIYLVEVRTTEVHCMEMVHEL